MSRRDLHVMTITATAKPARDRFVQVVHRIDVLGRPSVGNVQLMHAFGSEAAAKRPHGHLGQIRPEGVAERVAGAGAGQSLNRTGSSIPSSSSSVRFTASISSPVPHQAPP
jgi:hypothetical protein